MSRTDRIIGRVQVVLWVCSWTCWLACTIATDTEVPTWGVLTSLIVWPGLFAYWAVMRVERQGRVWP